MFKFIRFPRKNQTTQPNKAHEFMEWHSVRLGVLAAIACALTILWTGLIHADADLSLRMILGGFVMGLTLAICIIYRADWLDIYQLDREAQQEHLDLKTELKHRRKISTMTRFTCVYVLQDMDVSGFCKIGKSAMPANRIGHFDTMLPFNTRVVHIIEAKDCTALETMLHRHFEAKRRRGEWFALSPADIQWIIQIEAV